MNYSKKCIFKMTRGFLASFILMGEICYRSTAERRKDS